MKLSALNYLLLLIRDSNLVFALVYYSKIHGVRLLRREKVEKKIDICCGSIRARSIGPIP